MITLINPPGIKTFSGLQMHSPNPPLGLAYIAAAIKDAGLPCQVIDGTGLALDEVRPYPDRDDFMIQGLSFDEITARIHPDAEVIGVASDKANDSAISADVISLYMFISYSSRSFVASVAFLHSQPGLVFGPTQRPTTAA